MLRVATDGSCAEHCCTPDGHSTCNFLTQWVRDVQALLKHLDNSEAAKELLSRDIQP